MPFTNDHWNTNRFLLMLNLRGQVFRRSLSDEGSLFWDLFFILPSYENPVFGTKFGDNSLGAFEVGHSVYVQAPLYLSSHVA